MLTEIITIGDEILIGQIVDTNSAWIGQELNKIGIAVKQITSISDQEEHIMKALMEAETRADLILITGGLGPTKDDVTKKTLARYFNSGWRVDKEVEDHVRGIFEKRNLPILQVNLDQAKLPDNSKTLFNAQGTAPGMWLEARGKIFVSMPGVPYEMKHLMTERVLPALRQIGNLPHILHRTIVTAGIGESFLAREIEDIENELPAHIRLAYLPNLGTVRLRLSGKGEEATLLKAEVEEFANRITARIKEFVIAQDDEKPEFSLGKLLSEVGKSVGTVESCTGGYIAHLLTSIPGCSTYYKGSLLTYAYEAKTSLLGVKQSTLDQFGAVSEECIREMTAGAMEKLDTDYVIATSGIAGPGGGTPEKPVGTVWIAVGSKNQTIARKYAFSGGRQQVIERSAQTGLDMLRKLITLENK